MARLFQIKNSFSMKRLIFILSILALVASCRSNNGSHQKTQKDAEAEFISSLTQSDQDAVLALADDCMTKLRDGQVREAVDMIYILHDDVVYQKNAEYTEELVNRFENIFPVRSFERRYYSFSTQGNNDISYTYSFGDTDDGSHTMRLMFNPVFVDGQWYLTLKDGSQSSKDLPVDKQVHELAPAPQSIRLNKQQE